MPKKKFKVVTLGCRTNQYESRAYSDQLRAASYELAGDADADFQETLDVIQNVRFAKIHPFPYSERPRTRAAAYSDKVTIDVIQQRMKALRSVADKIASSLREEYVGETLSVLTESVNADRSGEIFGHTNNFLKVLVPSNGIKDKELTCARQGIGH